MSAVFISYRRRDTSGHAQALYGLLDNRLGAKRVFMDVDGISPGDVFEVALATALSECSVLIALIGTNWFGTSEHGSGERRIDNPADFVRREIEGALQSDVRIVPVLVDGATMPSEDQLPQSLKPIAARQYVSLRHSRFRDDVDHLLASIPEITAEQEPRQNNAEKDAKASELLPLPKPAIVVNWRRIGMIAALVLGAGLALRQMQATDEMSIVTDAWSSIGNAQGKTGDLGRKAAVAKLSELGIDMQDIDLSNADLNGVTLSRPNFYHGTFVRTTFVGAIISHSNFRTANLNCANFVDASLADSDLSLSHLHNTNFKNADLRRVNFRNARFGQTVCKEMTLFDTFLGGARIAGADFRGAEGLSCEILQMASDWELSIRDSDCGKPIPR